MQFLKKHAITTLYVVIAMALAFLGYRLFGESAKVSDIMLFAVFSSALLVMPLVEVGDKILKKLQELEPKTGAGPCGVNSVEPRHNRRDLEHALVAALAPGLVCRMDGAGIGHYIKSAADEIMGPVQAGFVAKVRDHLAQAGAMADQRVEAEIVAAGLTAPRVTNEQIQALMAKLSWSYEQPEGTTSTFAHAYLGRFYLTTGHSACVSPENFNAELGMKYAREQAEGKAREKLWELEGYKLHSAIAGQ